MINHEQLVRDFWKNGYLFVENFFDVELMDRLDGTLAIILILGMKRNTFWLLGAFPAIRTLMH